MSKFMTNDNVIGLFKQVDEIKANDKLSDEQRSKKISAIHDEIIEGLSFLVYNATKQYRKFPNYEDLVQEGFIGLIRAVKRFDHKLFPNFFVYSERWIKHTVKRSASRFDIVYSPNKDRVIYAEPSEVGKEESVEETPEDVFFAKETSEKIKEALDKFPDRDREIVKRVFGIGEYPPQTLREIGPIYNLTHERVRQIKNQIISKLRRNVGLSELY